MPRKLAPDRQAKLDRIHKRDCPAQRCLELGPCMVCLDIAVRELNHNNSDRR